MQGHELTVLVMLPWSDEHWGWQLRSLPFTSASTHLLVSVLVVK